MGREWFGHAVLIVIRDGAPAAMAACRLIACPFLGDSSDVMTQLVDLPLRHGQIQTLLPSAVVQSAGMGTPWMASSASVLLALVSRQVLGSRVLGKLNSQGQHLHRQGARREGQGAGGRASRQKGRASVSR